MTTKINLNQLDDALLQEILPGPYLANVLYYDDDTFANVLDDTAVGLDGGNIQIHGAGLNNVTLKIGDSTIASGNVTVVDDSTLQLEVPAANAGSYSVMVTNNVSGDIAILINAITYSTFPAWSTASELADQLSNVAFSINLSANSDSNITYTLSESSSLPVGANLAANGLLTGNVSTANDTTYNFTVVATDQENQDTARTFSVTVASPDVYLANNSLLLSADGSIRAGFSTDASTANNPMTLAGDTGPTKFSPYNTSYSNYFDGTDEYLAVEDDASLDFGAGDFTIEFWEHRLFAKNDVAPLQRRINNAGSSNRIWAVAYEHTGVLNSYFDDGAGTVHLTLASGTARYNEWVHRAYCRSGNTVYAFENGVLIASGALTETLGAGGTTLSIGRMQSGYDFPGYLSDVRLIKGTALYTSGFTPPTAPLTAVAGTSLLTCQSNQLVDKSNNNLTITRTGDVKVTNYTPFPDNTSVGSMRFDGTGDYIQWPAGTNWNFGTGAFTMEMWVYPETTEDNVYQLFSINQNGSNQWSWTVTTGSSWGMFFYWGNYGSNQTERYTGQYPVKGQWNHVVVSRDTDYTWRFYLNGTLIPSSIFQQNTTWSDSRDLNNTSINPRSGESLIGYIADVRITKGAAVYNTSTIDLPTAPLSAVSGTNLLTAQYRYDNNYPIDDSGKNTALRRNGTPENSTFTPYSPTGWSYEFSAPNVDTYVNIPVSVGFSGATVDVIEFDIYLKNLVDHSASSSDGTSIPFTFGEYTTYVNCGIGVNGNIGVSFRSGNTFSSGGQAPNGTIAAGRWHRVKIEKTLTAITLYVDGVVVATGSMNFSISFSYVWLGRFFYNAGSIFNAWSQMYMANFKFTQNNKVLIDTARSSGWKDYSPNNYTITPYNAVRIAPFAPESQIYTPDSYSVLLDGSGDFLTMGSNSDFDLGSSDFCMEAWFNSSNTSENCIFAKRQTVTATGWAFSVGYMSAVIDGTWRANFIGDGTGYLQAGTWYHVAITRSGNTFRYFRNGVLISVNSSYSGAIQNHASLLTIGAAGAAGNEGVFAGYISNPRIVIGSIPEEYQTSSTTTSEQIFTPSTVPLTNIANTAVLTAQSSTFRDNSDNAFTINVNGNSQISQVNPFGQTLESSGKIYNPKSHSVYFDGTGDYLVTAGGFPSGQGTEFTMECWIYVPSLRDQSITRGTSSSGNSGGYFDWAITSGGAIKLENVFVGSICISSNGAVRAGTWHHVAVTRTTGNIYKIYVDGLVVATSSAYNTSMNANNTLGYNAYSSSLYWSGYISNFRVTNTLVYTSAFIPNTVPLTSVSGTSLLACQSSTFIDNSDNEFAITVNGNSQPTEVNPFGQTLTGTSPTYTPTLHSGSMYFDGSGDYYYGTPSGDFTFGTGDFTVEAWYYIPSFAAARGIWSNGPSSAGSFFLLVASDGQPESWLYGDAVQTATVTTYANSWNHVAVTRSGTTYRVFVNGKQDITYTTSRNVTPTNCIIGDWSTAVNTPMLGYISDLHVVKGRALYTSAFVPPSSPIQATGGTVLLTNGTNPSGYNRFGATTIEYVNNVRTVPFNPYDDPDASSFYFDGGTDWLDLTNNTYGDTIFGTEPFTIECWVYPTASSSAMETFWIYGSTIDVVRMPVNSGTGVVSVEIRSTGQASTTLNSSSPALASQNTWTHIAAVRNGTELALYVNGVKHSTTISASASFNEGANAAFRIGAKSNTDGNYFTGYISDIRITKGVARYTTTFDPPTSPLKTQ